MLRNLSNILVVLITSCLLAMVEGDSFLHHAGIISVNIRTTDNKNDHPFVFVDRQLKIEHLSLYPLTIIKAQQQGENNNADPTGFKHNLILFPLVTLIAFRHS